MRRAISQGLDWAVSDIWLSPSSVSKYQPIPMVEDQFHHEALHEGAFVVLTKPYLHAKLLQLLEQGISPKGT